MLVHHMTAKTLDPVKRALAVLLPDYLAKLAAEQPHQFPAGGTDRLLGDDEELPFGHVAKRNAGLKPMFRSLNPPRYLPP